MENIDANGLMAIIGVLCGILLVVMLLLSIPVLFYIITLQKCLERVRPQNRAMDVGQMWLLTIPLFGIYWNFFVVARMRDSLRAEFKQRGLDYGNDDYGYSLGQIMSILNACTIVPVLGMIIWLGSFILWILYWVKISDYSRTLAAAPII